MIKRYEALYVVPDVCDGIYDNKTKEYLDDETIVRLLNKEDYDSIWENRFYKANERIKRLEHKLRFHPKIKLANDFIKLVEFAEKEIDKKNKLIRKE